MAVLAGVDEAGLGPLLGPLVVTGIAFQVPDDQIDRCLWDTLRESCSATSGRCGRRLTVADSKVVYRAGAGLSVLERTVLSVLAAAGRRPRTWRELLAQLAPDTEPDLAGYPWHDGADLPLPASEMTGDIPTHANAFRRDAAIHSVHVQELCCAPLLPARFNDLVRRTCNKSVVALGQTVVVLDRLLRAAGQESRVRICVDRQGGRMRYREALMTAFPGFDLQIVGEGEERSCYRLTRRGQICEVDFVVGADRACFPVALASMFSKYLRELEMMIFNRFWSGQIAGLRPTAGYYKDAKRWLRDAGGELRRRQVDRRILVRER